LTPLPKVKDLPKKVTVANFKLMGVRVKEKVIEYKYVLGSFVAGVFLTIGLLFAPVLGETEKFGESVELFGNILNDLDKVRGGEGGAMS